VRDAYLHIGDLVGAHGLKGALIVYSHTRPASAVAGYSCWWIGDDVASAQTYAVKRCWQHGKRVLVELDGVSDCNQAEALKGLKVWVPSAEVEVDDDEYLWDDLIGCKVVVHADGRLLGTVTALEEYGAQDNMVIRTAIDAATDATIDATTPGEWLIPFTEQTVLNVDLDRAVIVVDLPDGMEVCFTPKF